MHQAFLCNRTVDRFVDRSAVLPTVDPFSFPRPGCTWFRLHARYVRERVPAISLRSFYIVLYPYKSAVILINRVRYGSIFYVNWLPGRSTRFPDFFRKTFNPSDVCWLINWWIIADTNSLSHGFYHIYPLPSVFFSHLLRGIECS